MSIVQRTYQASLASSLFGLLLLLLAPAASAATGIEWLAAHSNPDGSYAIDNDVSDRIQSTSETIQTLNTLGETAQPGYSPALQYINAQSHHTTELLTRKIVANMLAGNDPSALVAELRAMKNEDGGFGDIAGYESTVLDTSFALLAFAQASGASNTEISEALGFIMSQQNADGSFRLGYRDTNSVYVTSLALSAMHRYALYFNLATNISKATSFLFKKQGTNGGWGETWETAFVLTTVVPAITDTTLYATAADSLRNAQLSNGSWNNDVYATSLALRALTLVDARALPAATNMGIVTGNVIDSVTGQPLSGVAVQLAEDPSIQANSGINGSFSLLNITSGQYNIHFQIGGYSSSTKTANVTSNQVTDLGIVTLSPVTNSAIVTGRITNAINGSVIAGALVTVTSATQSSASTDALGNYRLVVEGGAITVSVQATGYNSSTALGTLSAGGVLTYSPALQPTGSTSSGSTVTVRGRTRDNSSGFSISDVAIAVVGSTVTSSSDASGLFTLSSIPAGEFKLDLTKYGYQPVHLTLWAVAGAIVDLGDVRLIPSAVTSIVNGKVIDDSTGQAISGATLSVDVGGGAVSMPDGSFSIEGIASNQFKVTASAVGFLGSVANVSLVQPGIVFVEFKLKRAASADFNINSVTSTYQSYAALSEVELTAELSNTGASNRGVRLYIVVRNNSNTIVDQRPAVVVPLGGDPSAAIASVTAGSTVSKIVDWNTARFAPGIYHVAVQAFDATTSQLLAENTTDITISDSRKIGGLAEFDPPVAQSAANAPIHLTAELTNRGNLPIAAGTVTAAVSLSNNGYTQTRNLFSLEDVARDGSINQPRGVFVESTGNVLVANCKGNNLLRVTPSGSVTTVLSGLSCPTDVDIDSNGNILVLNAAQTITKLAPNGAVTQISTGKFSHKALKAMADGRILFSDSMGLFQISAAGVVQAITTEGLAQPQGVAIDTQGVVYISNKTANKISMFSNGVLSTFVGGLNQPTGITTDSNNNLYVVTFGDNKLVKIAPDRTVTTIATGLSGPYDVKRYSNGDFLVSNYNSSELLRITPSGVKTVIASSTVYSPSSVVYGNNGALYVLNRGARSINELFADGTSKKIGNTGTAPTLMTLADDNNFYFLDSYSTLYRMTQQGVVSLVASNLRPTYGIARAPDATGVVLNQYGSNEVIKVDFNGAISVFAQNHVGAPRMMKRDTAGNTYVLSSTGYVTKVSAQGVASRVISGLNQPFGLAVEPNGNLVIAEYGTQRLLRVDPLTGASSIIATLAFKPGAVAVDSAGVLYTAPYSNSTVYKVDALGAVSVFAQLTYPVDYDIEIDIDGTLWATHSGYQRVSKLTAAGALTVTTLNNNPAGLLLDGSGGVYVSGYGWVRQISASGTITELISNSVLGSTSYTGIVRDDVNRFWVSRGDGYIFRFSANRTLDKVFGAISGPYGLANVGSDLVIVNRVVGNVLRLRSTEPFPEVVGGGIFERVARFGPNTVIVTNFGNIKLMDLSSGAVTPLAVTSTTGSEISDVTATPDGRILVADTLANELTYFNASGQVVDRNIGVVNPKGIAIDSSGNIYVAPTIPSKIIRIDTAGTRTSYATISGNYLTLDQDGSLLVTTSDRIYRVSSGASSSTTALGFDPSGIAITPSGDFYAAATRGTLHRFKADWSQSMVASGVSRVEDIAVNSIGDVYVADYNVGAVARVLSDGRIAVFADNLGLAKGLQFDSSDTLYVLHNYVSVSSFTTSGARTNYPISNALGSGHYPTAIGINNAGVVYGSMESYNTIFRFAVDQAPRAINPGDIVYVVSKNIPELLPNDAQINIDFGTWIPPTSGDYEIKVAVDSGLVEGTLNNSLHVGATATGLFGVPQSNVLPGTRPITASLSITGADSTNVTRIYSDATALVATTGLYAVQGRGIVSDSLGNIFFGYPTKMIKISKTQVVSDYLLGLPGDFRMAIDQSDNIFYTNGKLVMRVAPGGAPTVFATFMSNVTAIAVGFDDLLYAGTAEEGLARIRKDGSIEIITKIGVGSPYEMTLDVFGNAYLLGTNNTITRVTPTGQVASYLETAGFEREGINVTTDCSNNLLIAPTTLPPLKPIYTEENTVYQIIGNTGEIRQVLYGPTIHSAMSDMDVFTYDKNAKRVLIYTDVGNGKVFSLPVECGGISVDAHIVTRSDVDLSSVIPAPTQSVTLSNGLKEYIWSLQGVDGNGKSVELNLALNNLVEGEQRPILSDAYLSYSNSFVPGQSVRVPIDIPTITAVTNVDLTPTLDATAYSPNTPVNISVGMANNNDVAFSGSVALAIRDVVGTLVTTLPTTTISNLPSHTTTTINAQWNTASMYVGEYKVTVELMSTTGAKLKSNEVPFVIQAQTAGNSTPQVSLAVSANKAAYQAWDYVVLSARTQNLATNALLPPSVVTVQVRTPSDTMVYTDAANNGQLVSGAIADQNFMFALADAAPGIYSITLIATNAATGVVLSTTTSSFQVNRTSVQSLAGNVGVDLRTVYVGDSNVCTNTITNMSSTSVADITVTSMLLNGDTGAIVEQSSKVVNLAAGAADVSSRAVFTTGYALGGYACVLQATVAGVTQTLGYGSFSVLKRPNVAPVADAGLGQSGHVGNTFVLSGINSHDDDGNALTYRWRFTERPAGSTAVLVNDTQYIAQFVADRKGRYVAELIVNDGLVDSAPSSVTVNVLNSTPVAVAGTDQSGYLGDTITMDGSASSDVDGDPLTYHWSITSAPEGSTATLANATSATPSLALDKHGSYTIQLVVNDGTVDSLPSSLLITVKNHIPTADAGADITTQTGATVTLDGSGSSDADHDPLSYRWSFMSVPVGSHATLTGLNTARPFFVPDLPGVYMASLIVNDGISDSAADFVTITVQSSKPEITTEFRISGKHRVLVLLGKSAPSDDAMENDDDETCPRTTRADLDLTLTPVLSGTSRVLIEAFDRDHHLLDSEQVTLGQFNGTANTVVGSAADLSVTSFDATHITVTLREPDATHALHDGLNIVATIWNNGVVQTLSSGALALDCEHRMAVSSEFGAFTVFKVQTSANDASLAPSYEQQRAFLEALLKREGWMYRIVDNAADFTRELRTVSYGMYAILSGGDKLEETVQKELREAVYGGDGLLVANGHDNRNQGLLDALGIKFKGEDPKAVGIQLPASDLSAGGNALFAYNDNVLRAELKGARDAGHYTYPISSTSSVDREHSDDESATAIAATIFEFGRGRSVYMGFDTLGNATASGDTSLFADLLADALVYINPPIRTKAGDVVELELTLTDKKVAATGQVELTLPAGFTVIDAGAATSPVSVTLLWTFDLAEGASAQLRLAVRVPDTAGSKTITGLIKVRLAGVLEDYGTLSLPTNVTAVSTLRNAIDLATSLSAIKKSPVNYSDILKSLKQVDAELAAGRMLSALKEFLKSTDKLQNAGSVDADRLRAIIDDAIRAVERKLQPTP